MNPPFLTRHSRLSIHGPWRPAAATAILFALLPWSAARAASPLILTMEQGVELALEHNHELLKSRQERDRADASIAEARSAAYPGVDLDLLYNHSWIQSTATITVEGEDADGNPVEQTQSVTFGQPNYLSAGVSLQQTIYAGGKVRHGLEAARVYADQTRATTRVMEQGIAYQVQRIFLGTIMAREAIEVAQLALQQAQAHQEQVDQRFAKGNASEFDLIRAQVEVAQPAALLDRSPQRL